LEGKTINFVTLSARNEKLFMESIPSFEEMVRSYSFLEDKIPPDGKNRGFFQEGIPKD
jgi:hypothetical protein